MTRTEVQIVQSNWNCNTWEDDAFEGKSMLRGPALCSQLPSITESRGPANTAVKPKRRCEQGRNVEQCCDKKCSAFGSTLAEKLQVESVAHGDSLGQMSSLTTQLGKTIAQSDCDAFQVFLFDFPIVSTPEEIVSQAILGHHSP